MDNAVLPTIVSLATVAKFFELEATHSYTENSAETLLRVIDEYSIPIYLLHAEIFGVQQRARGEECSESLEPSRFFSPTLRVKVEDGGLNFSKKGAPQLYISTFKIDGDIFRVTNQEGTLCSTSYSLESFYFDRDDITRLKEKLSNTPKTAKTNFSIQNKRELAFKFWLVTKANEKGGTLDHLETDPQKCYVAINSPTQEIIWNSLNEIDNQLFTPGKDDFFKRQKLVAFKKGTGVKR
jgi:hypothetical protein